MAKNQPPLDVLVLGDHPAAYLCATLLHLHLKIRVLHATLPGQRPPDRLALLNPALFDLHPLLKNLRRHLDLTALYGARFLADDPATAGEHRARSTLVTVTSTKSFSAAVAALSRKNGLTTISPKELNLHCIDEKGLEITLDRKPLRPKALILADDRLSDPHRRLLGLYDPWDLDVLHRYTFVKVAGPRPVQRSSRPILPLSLDLRGQLCCGWLLTHGTHTQLAVSQPVASLSHLPALELLSHWTNLLRQHKILSPTAKVPLDAVQSLDLPQAGALAHEGVANRTLLIGPAGGFYSACAEDLYPNCWSALAAAEILRKALPEPHLQDALQPYRSRWRTTLGEYLRGPQQNLRFLLPMVYRNPVMTARMAEAVLLGKNVVR